MKAQRDEVSGRILLGNITGVGGGHAAGHQVPMYLNLYLNWTPFCTHA